MSKFARIEDGAAVEIISVPDGFTIDECFHADVVSLFTACPEDVTVGSTVDNKGTWSISPVAPVEEPAPKAPKVSPVQFKLLFTAPERVAIKASTDAVVKDFFEIVNDPRLTFVDLGLQSTQDAMTYLVGKNLLTAARAAEVLTGVLK